MNDDLILLREVLRINPFEDVKNRYIIKEKVNATTPKRFSLPCFKKHVQ